MDLKLGRYRKLFAALIGLAVLIAMRWYQIEIPGVDSVVIDLIISALTSIGVYQVPNDPMEA